MYFKTLRALIAMSFQRGFILNFFFGQKFQIIRKIEKQLRHFLHNTPFFIHFILFNDSSL